MKPVIFFSLIFIFVSAKPAISQTLTGDPMIFKAYREIYNRSPNALEINIKNYNAGTWNSYEELKNFIKDFQNSLLRASLTISSVYLKEVVVIGIRENGQQIAVAALSMNGGKILANNGSAIVSGVAGNIISGNGGNLTGQDGSGIIVNTKMGGIGYASGDISPSANTRLIISGKGSLVIAKK